MMHIKLKVRSVEHYASKILDLMHTLVILTELL